MRRRRNRTFRRGRVRRACWYGYLAVLWAASLLFALAFVLAAFPLREFDFNKAAFMVACALLSFSSARAALGWSEWIRGMRDSFVVVNDEGVLIHVDGQPEVRLYWPDITGVRSETVPAVMGTWWKLAYQLATCTVMTTHGEYQVTAWDVSGVRAMGKFLVERRAAR